MTERWIRSNITRIERILINNDITGIMTRDEDGNDNEIAGFVKNVNLALAEKEIKEVSELIQKATRLVDDLEDERKREEFREALETLMQFRVAILEDIKTARREGLHANIGNVPMGALNAAAEETYLRMEGGEAIEIAKWA